MSLAIMLLCKTKCALVCPHYHRRATCARSSWNTDSTCKWPKMEVDRATCAHFDRWYPIPRKELFDDILGAVYRFVP